MKVNLSILRTKFNTKMVFRKAMPAGFRVTLFNGCRDNDGSNHLPSFVPITVTTAVENVTRKACALALLKIFLKFYTANKLFI